MIIGFLTPEYPHANTGASGGLGTSIKNLAAGLLKQGVAIRILVYGQKADALFDDNKITIQQIKNVKVKGLSWYLTRKKIETIINQLYDDKMIDVIEAPDWTGITSFIQPVKCPVFIRLHGSDTYFCHIDKRQVKWINKYHEKRALQKANGHISVSSYTALLTNQLFGQKIGYNIIPNSVDVIQFKPAISTESDDVTILYFGTLIRKKGMLELPYIFNEVNALHSHARLLIVGKDSVDAITGQSSTWQIMQTLFNTEALQKVSYAGSVRNHEMMSYIAKAAVCVFPSFAEALPVSWIEAMAMGKAIVASNIGWASELIDDGMNGLLEHPANHKQYASKIVDLLNNKERRNTMGALASKKAVSCFSNDFIAEKNLRFYRSKL